MTGLDLVECQAADFVGDQQFGLHQRIELSMEQIGIDGSRQSLGQIHRGGEVNAIPHFSDEHSKGDGQTRFSRSRRAKKDN